MTLLEPISREKNLFALLNAQNISHETCEHPPVFTVEESQEIKAALSGGHTKNLFLTDKAGVFVLVCALGATPVRLNRLHKTLGTKRLSFAKEEALWEHLGVWPGSVTLFSLINDSEKQVRLVLDNTLFDYERVWFHPLRNTASTAISPRDMSRFAKATGHLPFIVDFKSLAAE